MSKREHKIDGYLFRSVLASICPDYAVDQDNYGQLVIYTNLREIDGDIYVDWTEDTNE
jgi:hypothetical protein